MKKILFLFGFLLTCVLPSHADNYATFLSIGGNYPSLYYAVPGAIDTVTDGPNLNYASMWNAYAPINVVWIPTTVPDDWDFSKGIKCKFSWTQDSSDNASEYACLQASLLVYQNGTTLDSTEDPCFTTNGVWSYFTDKISTKDDVMTSTIYPLKACKAGQPTAKFCSGTECSGKPAFLGVRGSSPCFGAYSGFIHLLSLSCWQ